MLMFWANVGKVFLIILVFHPEISAAASKCNARDYGNGSPICVCDSEYCDFVEQVEPFGEQEAVLYTSDKSGRRLERTTIKIKTVHSDIESADIVIDPSKKYQTIEGFGGAFTDAAGINIARLPKSLQDTLLRSYFSKDGMEYNIGRIPVASSDFSTHTYSYDDVENDFELRNFALTEEDHKYKIPFVKAAQSYTNNTIRFFGSSWSAPAWMKTNGKMEGNGTLRGQPLARDKYYSTWANYYLRFLQEYAKKNISFWTLTAQNEPSTGYIYKFEWQAQGFTPEMQRDFIKNHLGPILEKGGFGDVSIMILDDHRLFLPAWPRRVLHDRKARKYISHIAVHWYVDQFVPTATLEATHKEFPNFPLIATESCQSGNFLMVKNKRPVVLGNWKSAESYCQRILEDLNHWFVGWVDWNLALDSNGGPNWAKNFVDSPIIVNATSGEFYKQPSFYALGHFSKFLPRDSRRIEFKSKIGDTVDLASFITPKGYRTMVMLNKHDINRTVKVGEIKKKRLIDVEMPGRSIVTVIWK